LPQAVVAAATSSAATATFRFIALPSVWFLDSSLGAALCGRPQECCGTRPRRRPRRGRACRRAIDGPRAVRNGTRITTSTSAAARRACTPCGGYHLRTSAQSVVPLIDDCTRRALRTPRNERDRVLRDRAGQVDAEMEVRPRAARVARVADPADRLAGTHLLAVADEQLVQVCVVVAYAALRVALPDDQPAHAGVARPLDVAVRDRKHGRAAGREDVDALVRARTAVARVAEHAAYVGQAAAGDRKQQRRGAIHDH